MTPFNLMAELLNTQHWDPLYQGSHEGQPIGGRPGAFLPIEIQSPVLAESPILRGFCTSESAKSWWYKGCDLSIRLQTFGVETQVARGVLPLNHRNLIVAPLHVASTFLVYFQVPWWHKDLYISVDQYVGPIDDAVEAALREQIEITRVDLVRIETKVDEIRTTLNP